MTNNKGLIKRNDCPASDRGFTIVELMIALSVLSTILVMSSFILIQIGSIYSKGVSKATLQNANRNIVSDISQAIQFGGNPPLSCTSASNNAYCYTLQSGGSNGTNSYCIDTTRYSYVMNKELGKDEGTPSPTITNHVLWRDTMKSANDGCAPLDLSAATPSDLSTVNGSGYEMMPNHTRLTRFYTSPNSANGAYDISIWMAYGDSDLVNSNFGLNPPKTPTCNSGSGSQFCAVSTIDTQVTRRKSN